MTNMQIIKIASPAQWFSSSKVLEYDTKISLAINPTLSNFLSENDMNIQSFKR